LSFLHPRFSLKSFRQTGFFSSPACLKLSWKVERGLDQEIVKMAEMAVIVAIGVIVSIVAIAIASWL
jgi:hypothetical protein